MRYKQDIFYNMGGQTLEQVAQRGGTHPTPGNVQGQAGRCPKQLDLAEGVPTHCRVVGLDDL